MERKPSDALDELGQAISELGGSVGKLAIWIALSTMLGLWRAWVMVKLWGWFVVPAFGLPPLRVVIAYGLVTLFAALREKGLSKELMKPTGRSEALNKIFTAAFGLLLIFIVGWVASFFV